MGSHLCDRFLAEGWEVEALDNLLTGREENLAHLRGHPLFRFRKHDVTQRIELQEPVDLVLHFASPASPRDYLNNPIHTMKVDSLGTLHTLGVAKRYGSRYLLASTSEVYGDPEVHPQPEDYWGHVNPVGPRSVYDEAKRFAEALTMAYHREHGVDVRIVRIFNTYGPRMRPDDGRAIPTFVVQALRGEPMTVRVHSLAAQHLCPAPPVPGDVRGRHADPEFLLRGRPGGRDLPDGGGRPTRGDRAEPGQPGRVYRPGPGTLGAGTHRELLAHRLPPPAVGRPPPPLPGHQPCPAAARLGAPRPAPRRPPPHDRLLPRCLTPAVRHPGSVAPAPTAGQRAGAGESAEMV